LIVSTPITGWKTGMGVGRAGEEQLAGDARIDLEPVRRLQELPDRGLGIVALPPASAGEQRLGQVLDERVEDDQVAASRDQRAVQLELAEHVGVRVVGVQHDQHAPAPARLFGDPARDRRIGR
jgi:hypothetical protein